jgi:hypothetical protein
MATFSKGSSLAEGSAATDRLIASDQVEGMTVFNRQGEQIGSVYKFMVDKRTGQVAYAIMSFGGFLGIGDTYHPLPWESLHYDTDTGGYVIDLDRSKLESAPKFRLQDKPWRDSDYGQVQNYWGVGSYYA